MTINALAQDDNGEIIDPYNGLGDLQNRLLRHVSPAFGEDPLRVLRVARFAARYAHLGFRKAEVDVFPELSCFFDDPTDVGNLISGSSAFSKSSLDEAALPTLVHRELDSLRGVLMLCGKAPA